MMKTISKALKSFESEAKQSDTYWIEEAKFDFSLSLEQQRKQKNMSYKSLAASIGTSAAYVSKVFRGDANLTIGSMVKLTRALGGKLHIHISDAAEGVIWWRLIEGSRCGPVNVISPTINSSTTTSQSVVLLTSNNYASDGNNTRCA